VATPGSEWRSQVEVLVQVALVKVDVPHHHHISRVAEDAPQALDLAPLPQVPGGEGVAELVGVDPEADLDL